MDIAPLTFRIESSSAVAAEGDLDQLTAAAGRADTAQESLAASAGRAAAAETNMSAKAKAATQAINAHTAATKANAAAMNMQAVSAGQVAARQQQMMFQTNDIAMSLASGQAPYMVAIQQGSQLAQVYAGPGGLNNAIGDFNKLMGGVIGTLVRFAGPMALAAAGAATLYYGYREVTRAGRELDDALKSLEEIMAENVDVMADAHEYAQRIDLARIGREADQNVDPLDRMAGSLSRVAAALNDVVVARFIEQTTAIGEQIRKLEAEIAVLDNIEDRANARLDPSALYSAGGMRRPGLNDEQELRRRQARGQLATLQREFQQMGRNVLSPDEARDFWGNLATGKFAEAFEGFSTALNGTLEPAKKTGRAIDEAGRAMERLINEADKYADGRAKAQLDEIEYINYRRDRDIASIEDTAQAAIEAGNNVRSVEATAQAAIIDRREQAEHDIADLRERLAERTLSTLRSDFDAWIRDIEAQAREVERRERDIERLNNDRVGLNRSLQPGSDTQQVDWWEADQLARNDEIWREEVRLYGEAQAERLGLKQDYLNRETEIERIAAEDRKRIRQAQYSATVGITADFFGTMGQLLDSNTEKQSAAAEAAFAIAKGLDLAQAIMNSYVAVTEAWADPTLPYFMKIAASIQAATTVMAAVANIRSVTLSGAREMGGPVYGGGTYLVGEKGPELFTPGASGQITSNANLQRAVAGNQGGTQGQTGTVRLIMPDGWRAQMDDTARRLIRVEAEAEAAPAKAVAKIVNDMASGGTEFSDVGEGVYGWNRAAGSF